MHYPVPEKYKITYDFGETNNDIYYTFEGKHPGLDFKMPVGEPIFATLPGYVYRIEFHRGMGKIIGIRYGNIQHMYAHLSKIFVDYGDWIEEGQKIALSGDTCVATNPHLHFELRDRSKSLKDRPINPDFSLKVPREFTESFIITTTGNEALEDLAVKFFGSEKGAGIIKSANPSLQDIKEDYVSLRKYLPTGLKVVIPLM